MLVLRGGLVGSGSRFSRVNCDRRQSWIWELNVGAGRLLVSIGRHSLMNGVSQRDRRLIPEEELAQFVAELRGCYDAIDRHARHARCVLEQNLTRWHVAEGDVALGDYLAARPSDLEHVSARAARELLDEIVGPD